MREKEYKNPHYSLLFTVYFFTRYSRAECEKASNWSPGERQQ